MTARKTRRFVHKPCGGPLRIVEKGRNGYVQHMRFRCRTCRADVLGSSGEAEEVGGSRRAGVILNLSREDAANLHRLLKQYVPGWDTAERVIDKLEKQGVK